VLAGRSIFSVTFSPEAAIFCLVPNHTNTSPIATNIAPIKNHDGLKAAPKEAIINRAPIRMKSPARIYAIIFMDEYSF
jgi:hypothetical protein